MDAVLTGNPTAERPTEFTKQSLRVYKTQQQSTRMADKFFLGKVDYEQWAANIGDPRSIVECSGLTLADHLQRWHLIGGTNAEGEVGAGKDDADKGEMVWPEVVTPGRASEIEVPGPFSEPNKKQEHSRLAYERKYKVRRCPHKWPLPETEPVVLEALKMPWPVLEKAAEVLRVLIEAKWFEHKQKEAGGRMISDLRRELEQAGVELQQKEKRSGCGNVVAYLLQGATKDGSAWAPAPTPTPSSEAVHSSSDGAAAAPPVCEDVITEREVKFLKAKYGFAAGETTTAVWNNPSAGNSRLSGWEVNPGKGAAQILSADFRVVLEWNSRKSSLREGGGAKEEQSPRRKSVHGGGATSSSSQYGGAASSSARRGAQPAIQTTGSAARQHRPQHDDAQQVPTTMELNEWTIRDRASCEGRLVRFLRDKGGFLKGQTTKLGWNYTHKKPLVDPSGGRGGLMLKLSDFGSVVELVSEDHRRNVDGDHHENTGVVGGRATTTSGGTGTAFLARSRAALSAPPPAGGSGGRAAAPEQRGGYDSARSVCDRGEGGAPASSSAARGRSVYDSDRGYSDRYNQSGGAPSWGGGSSASVYPGAAGGPRERDYNSRRDHGRRGRDYRDWDDTAGRERNRGTNDRARSPRERDPRPEDRAGRGSSHRARSRYPPAARNGRNDEDDRRGHVSGNGTASGADFASGNETPYGSGGFNVTPDYGGSGGGNETPYDSYGGSGGGIETPYYSYGTPRGGPRWGSGSDGGKQTPRGGW